MPRPELSLVIPIYNEEAVLPQLDARLKELLTKLAVDTEVVFVNDGSKDKSIDILRRMASHEARYKVLGFSRNFGHQRAITAGMDKSRGRAVVVMDADLQDPPEVILEMVAKWHEGFDVVYGRRRSREGESAFKLLTAKWFYRLFAALIPIEVPLDTGDFRLMSRRVVQTLRGLRESHRFVRGLVAWVGFRQTAVEYDRAARAAGETKYPLRKMLAFAIDGIASFSIQPLRFATYVGAFTALASVLYGVIAVITKIVGSTVPGWTTTVILISFLFSVQFMMIGVLGEYVGRIYEQVKRRPLYIVSERINFSSKKREQALATQDIVESRALMPRPSPSFPPALPKSASVPPVPPPPAAVVAAGAEAEAQIAGPPSNRRSVTPAAPATASNKPPPLSLSPSVGRMAAASEPPRRPSFSAIPHPAATTPSRPPMPPSIPKTPSQPPVRPSAPPVKAPAAPRPKDIGPATTRSPSNAPPSVAPKKAD